MQCPGTDISTWTSSRYSKVTCPDRPSPKLPLSPRPQLSPTSHLAADPMPYTFQIHPKSDLCSPPCTPYPDLVVLYLIPAPAYACSSTHPCPLIDPLPGATSSPSEAEVRTLTEAIPVPHGCFFDLTLFFLGIRLLCYPLTHL